jgi:Phage integrase, N-terminal SAM-like domain
MEWLARSTFPFAKERIMTALRQRMTEDMQVRNLALNTQMSYVQQVSLFARHFDKSPEQLGPEDIRAYQVYLTNEKKLAPGSVLIAVAALWFLHKVSLKKKWNFGDVIPAPKKPQKLPLVLSPEEERWSSLDSHLAPARGLQLDHTFFELRAARRDQLDECRLGGFLLSAAGRSTELFLQSRIVEP